MRWSIDLKSAGNPKEQSLVDDALDAIKKKSEGDSTDAPSHLTDGLSV